MEIKRRRTDRLRPELTPGGTVLGLSVPQHDEISEPVAVQKHHPTPAAMHPKKFPCYDR
jgi:hypothetical protein